MTECRATFEITPRGGKSFECHGRNYLEAALHAAQRLHGHRTTITVLRTTGDDGKSGYFQAYRQIPQRIGGGRTCCGESFHVTLTAFGR